MKSILKLIKRFIVTMLFTLVLLFFLNLFLFLLVSYRQAANHGAWSSADTVASALTQNRDGTYQLSAQGEDVLSRTDAWAILVDNIFSGTAAIFLRGYPRNTLLPALLWQSEGISMTILSRPADMVMI